MFLPDGTHCAGTVGGAHFGVAKRALLHGIKVLDRDGSGSDRTIIAGIDFATKHALEHGRPSVLSLSLGGGASQALDDAVRSAIQSGVHVVLAAGNDGEDASLSSPSRVKEAIVVGATDIEDKIASFSNIGSVVDVFAPGVQITSAGIDSDTDSKTFSGTSMSWSVFSLCLPSIHPSTRSALPLLANTCNLSSVNYPY